MDEEKEITSFTMVSLYRVKGIIHVKEYVKGVGVRSYKMKDELNTLEIDDERVEEENERIIARLYENIQAARDLYAKNECEDFHKVIGRIHKALHVE